MADASGSTEPMLAQPGTRPSAVRIESAWCEPTVDWTVAAVKAALSEHDSGRFRDSAALVDQMLRDPVIAGDLATRCRALGSRSALTFKVEPGMGDGRKRERARSRCEDLWWSACPETTVGAILRDGIMLGVGVGRVWWERDTGDWRPRLVHLPVHGLEWSEWERKWVYTTRDGKALDVTPGDGTWFLYTPHGDRSWLLGAVRQLGMVWLMRDYARRDWARFSERNGMPVLAMYEPMAALDDVEGTGGATGSSAAAFYRGLRAKMGRDAVLRLPKGADDASSWDAKWLELTGKSYETFPQQLDKLATEIHTSILGRDPNAGSKGGDGELAGERRHNENLSTDAETMSTAIRDCVWKPDVAFNIDPTDLELAAWGRWDTRPPADLGARAKTLDTAADAIGKLAALGVDCQPVAAEFGLTGTIDAPKPAPAPAPPADQPNQ